VNKKTFTTVTPFSKAVALLMFIALPFIGFQLGRAYQRLITPSPVPIGLLRLAPVENPIDTNSNIPQQ
jgi:hypothetical protein